MTSEPLRVLYVINGLGTGGAERSLAELVAPLRHRGIEVSVACLERRTDGVETEVRESTQVELVGPGLAQGWRGIRRAIATRSPDVVHTTLFDSDVLGRLAAIGTGVPVVTSIVNTSYERLEDRNPDVPAMKLRFVRAIDGFTARHLVRRFHALTRASAESATRALGIRPHLIDVIPRGRDTDRLGVNTEERKEAARSTLGLGADQFVMLSVGRREHQKGQEYAIEAVVEVSSRRPDAVLLVSGRDGSASVRLERKVAALGLDDRVRFLGHRADVPDLMVAADVLVFPSLYEGFGLPVLEAMASGTPVVTSRGTAMEEVAGGAAVLVDPYDAAAIAAGVAEAEARRAELVPLGLARATEFTWERAADRVETLWKELA